MLTAEPIKPPENGPNPFEWPGRLGAVGRIAEQPEPFLSEREKDVVLARKVAVDGRRAVLDALRDFSNRHVPVALGREEIARGVENGSTDGFPVALLAFFDPHLADVPLTKLRLKRSKSLVEADLRYGSAAAWRPRLSRGCTDKTQ